MCERIEKLVASEFEKLTGIKSTESSVMHYSVFPQKREDFKPLLRAVLPDLRISSSEGLITVEDFANYVEKEEEKKKEFFAKGLQIIRDVTGDETLTLEDDLYAELRPTGEGNEYLSAQTKYFVKANKVYNALAEGLKSKRFAYYPPLSLLEKSRTLAGIIDLYYRRGKF